MLMPGSLAERYIIVQMVQLHSDRQWPDGLVVMRHCLRQEGAQLMIVSNRQDMSNAVDLSSVPLFDH